MCLFIEIVHRSYLTSTYHLYYFLILKYVREGLKKKDLANFGYWLKLGVGGVRKGFECATLLYGKYS